jgi:hypothetical protein
MHTAPACPSRNRQHCRCTARGSHQAAVSRRTTAAFNPIASRQEHGNRAAIHRADDTQPRPAVAKVCDAMAVGKHVRDAEGSGCHGVGSSRDDASRRHNHSTVRNGRAGP